jgi:hypothetical protein
LDEAFQRRAVIIDVNKASACGHTVGVRVTDPATGKMAQAAASDRATAEHLARNVLAAGEQQAELSLVVCVDATATIAFFPTVRWSSTRTGRADVFPTVEASMASTSNMHNELGKSSSHPMSYCHFTVRQSGASRSPLRR